MIVAGGMRTDRHFEAMQGRVRTGCSLRQIHTHVPDPQLTLGDPGIFVYLTVPPGLSTEKASHCIHKKGEKLKGYFPKHIHRRLHLAEKKKCGKEAELSFDKTGFSEWSMSTTVYHSSLCS